MFLNPCEKTNLKEMRLKEKSNDVLLNTAALYKNQQGSTSSTAQGGGGSCKDRKPIREVCCCESLMAEQIH